MIEFSAPYKPRLWWLPLLLAIALPLPLEIGVLINNHDVFSTYGYEICPVTGESCEDNYYRNHPDSSAVEFVFCNLIVLMDSVYAKAAYAFLCCLPGILAIGWRNSWREINRKSMLAAVALSVFCAALLRMGVSLDEGLGYDVKTTILREAGFIFFILSFAGITLAIFHYIEKNFEQGRAFLSNLLAQIPLLIMPLLAFGIGGGVFSRKCR